RTIDPNIAVVAISGVLLRTTGRTALDLLSMNRDLSAIATLQKPFRPAQLQQAIKKALDLVAAQKGTARDAVASPAEQAPTDGGQRGGRRRCRGASRHPLNQTTIVMASAAKQSE